MDNVHRKLIDRLSKGISDIFLEKNPGGIPQKLSECIPEELHDGSHEGILNPWSNSEGFLARHPEKCLEDAQGFPEVCPEGCPEGCLKELSEVFTEAITKRFVEKFSKRFPKEFSERFLENSLTNSPKKSLKKFRVLEGFSEGITNVFPVRI